MIQIVHLGQEKDGRLLNKGLYRTNETEWSILKDIGSLY